MEIPVGTLIGEQIIMQEKSKNLSLLILMTVMAFAAFSSSASAATCSTASCTLDIGKYRLDNNKWGNTGATQSIFTGTSTAGWQWSNPGSGWNYPEIIAGNARNCGSNTWSAFPIQYKNLNSASADIAWKFTEKPTAGSWWNLAFDIYWMDNTNNCDSGKKYNIMIWIHGKPDFAGYLVADDISDGYNTYSYYRQDNKGWPWEAFVLKNRGQIPYEPVLNQQYSITINIKALMNAINRPVDGNWYLSGMELGGENSGYLGSTSGRIEISKYDLRINGNVIGIGATCTPDWQCETPLNGYEYDGCNNRRANPACNAVNNPPSVSASHSPASPKTTDNVVITASASDDKGLSEISIYADSALKKTCAVSGTSTSCSYASTFPAGTHNYYATAKDNSGKTATASTKQFTISAATQTVSTPAYTPSSGTYSTAQSVAISTSTAGATIRYTLDGTTPTEASSIYTTSIPISSTKTIIAKAWKTGLTPSASASATYTINSNHSNPSTSALTLKPGWNQISSPIAAGIDIATIESSCTILPYKAQKLWGWNAQSQTWIYPTKVEPLKGYWIYAAYACTVTLSGTPATFSNLQLYTGWNKISASGTFSAIQGTCATHIIGNWMWHWDKTTEKWIHPATLQLDKGYWIKVDQNCVLGG